MTSLFIPYRDRKNHLDIFIPHMQKYLPDAQIFVGEQVDNKPFNRGKILNILYLETKPSYFVAHDVDMIPVNVDYSFSPWVTQLAQSKIQKLDYLGGVTMFTDTSFEEVGGYNNDYYFRAEDNELRFNLKRIGIPVSDRTGIFNQLPHERNKREFIPYLWRMAQQRRKIQNQLGICKYNLVSREQKEGYTLLKVEL